MIKAIRVFYRKLDNQIVWTHTLEGTGKFSITVVDELRLLPETKIFYSEDSFNLFGGTSSDYACIEETDPQRASDFLVSDANKIADGKLVIGAPRPILLPVDSPDKILLKQYLADPTSSVPSLTEAFQALARLYLGVK